jgi:LmbE family N-acetylglucosaminyl deacetylase
MNRGEGFCKGADPSRCGAVRTEEARRACEILKARPAFVGQIDGQSIVDNTHYEDFRHLLDSEKPDIVFAQWPIDRHRDHRALSMLVLDAWLKGGKQPALYYYEVFEDTMMFSPTEYVDISANDVEALRHAASYAHTSQEPDKWYPGQVTLTRFRGSQSGHAQAESFLRHWESKRALLP